jgi:hypothetical protein
MKTQPVRLHNRIGFGTIGLALLIALVAPIPNAWAGNLALFAWDGAGLNHVQPMLDAGKLPNLQALLSSGGHLCPLELITRIDAIPVFTQVFTGRSYDQSGVCGSYSRRTSNVYDQTYVDGVFTLGDNVWLTVLPFVRTVPQIARLRGNAIGWFVSSPELSTDATVTPLALIAKSATQYAYSSPAANGDSYLPQIENDALGFIRSRSKFFVFVQLTPEYYGEQLTDADPRFEQEIERCDAVLGDLLGAIDRQTTNVIVMADHGFDPGRATHLNAPDAWMVTDLPVHPAYWQQANQRAFASPRDMATMMLKFYGVNVQKYAPQQRGNALLQ